MIRGIDVSVYQQTIAWPSVAGSGVKFAIARTGRGNAYVDPLFEKNWDGAKSAGIHPAAYHVLFPWQSVDSQVIALRSILDGNDAKLIAIDCELSGGGDEERAVYWMLRKCRERFTEATILPYSALWWWNPNVGSQQWVREDGYPFWVAAYGPNNGQQWAPEPPASVMPVDWNTWHIWQYTSKGVVPGISGSVDLDLMKDDFFQQIWGAPVEPPPQEPVVVQLQAPRNADRIEITLT